MAAGVVTTANCPVAASKFFPAACPPSFSVPCGDNCTAPVRVHSLLPALISVSYDSVSSTLPLLSTVPVMSFGVAVLLAPRNRLVNAGQVCPDAERASAFSGGLRVHGTLRSRTARRPCSTERLSAAGATLRTGLLRFTRELGRG